MFYCGLCACFARRLLLNVLVIPCSSSKMLHYKLCDTQTATTASNRFLFRYATIMSFAYNDNDAQMRCSYVIEALNKSTNQNAIVWQRR